MANGEKKQAGRTQNKIVSFGGSLYSMPAPTLRIYLAEKAGGNTPKIENFGKSLGSVAVDLTALTAQQAAALVKAQDESESAEE